mmetsp:Transcript_15856/g.44905  ORF Transcript_15856/g.44905 Transcript_15856/m.44905 type:complete len:96 (+) Transcript_15856:406-693(+)
MYSTNWTTGTLMLTCPTLRTVSSVSLCHMHGSTARSLTTVCSRLCIRLLARTGRPSTAENIAVYVWEQLQPHLGGLLFQVKIEETENNFAIYRGG